MLKSPCFILLFSCAALAVQAQRHEIGVQLGVSNLVGDIGSTNFILQKPVHNNGGLENPIHEALLYRRNFNPYQSVRLNLGYSNVSFNDTSAKEEFRKKRGYWGNNSVYNADLVFEYNFYPVNNEQQAMLSPYVFGGIGAIVYSKVLTQLVYNSNEYKIDEATKSFDNTAAMSIPFGAGLKYKFNYNWALFGELKFRYTFTDGIDYNLIKPEDVKVFPTDLPKDQRNAIAEAYVKDQSFGNKNSNDWVNTVSIGVSYSFGRPPCYCDTK